MGFHFLRKTNLSHLLFYLFMTSSHYNMVFECSHYSVKILKSNVSIIIFCFSLSFLLSILFPKNIPLFLLRFEIRELNNHVSVPWTKLKDLVPFALKINRLLAFYDLGVMFDILLIEEIRFLFTEKLEWKNNLVILKHLHDWIQSFQKISYCDKDNVYS